MLQGSKKLDANFEDFMAQLVGDELYEAWCTNHPGGGCWTAACSSDWTSGSGDAVLGGIQLLRCCIRSQLH
jgi:hypothetical protein